MEKCRWAMGGILALVLLCWTTSGPAADEKTPPDKKAVADSKADDAAVFDMKEVSLYDQKGGAATAQFPIVGGQTASLSTEPAKEVKAYPKLNSKRPLYGSISFNRRSGKPGPTAKFYFVLDQSAATEKAEKAAGSEADEPAADQPPKNRYDRLCFDVNHDLDLTNDAVASPMKSPPASLARFTGGQRTTVVFDTISVPVDADSKAQGQALSVLPISFSYGTGGQMLFLAASARKGDIRLGKRAYTAMLFSQDGSTTGLDRPNSQLILTPVDGPKPTRSSNWMNALSNIREVDGEFYTISATPSGDKLTVRPVGGDRGEFELSSGKKDVKPLGMIGILRVKNSMLLLGDMSSYFTPGERATTAKYRLPVGSYQPLMLRVEYGGLQIGLRADYTRGTGSASKPAGGIEISKDKPYVLDFTSKPVVDFQSPPKDKTFKPGDAVRLAAMIKIPDKGLMITGLEDMSKKVGEMKWTAEDGKQMTSPSYASLEPTVVITDSSGKQVAKGKMPFG
jgi:hypothetical protein